MLYLSVAPNNSYRLYLYYTIILKYPHFYFKKIGKFMQYSYSNRREIMQGNKQQSVDCSENIY